MPHDLTNDEAKLEGKNQLMEKSPIDRPINFNNIYRLKCKNCGRPNIISGIDYGLVDYIDCLDCKKRFNYDRSDILLRSDIDLALKDENLSTVIWYHTTDVSGWPRASKPVAPETIRYLKSQGFTREQIFNFRRKNENQALHLGTYEAAIESMLRRMEQQNARDSKFFLHQVLIRRNLTFEPVYRNETSEEAAQVTSEWLRNAKLDGIRYLNAYESIGSISLAIVRSGIASTRAINMSSLPILDEIDIEIIEGLKGFHSRVSTIIEDGDQNAYPGGLGKFLNKDWENSKTASSRVPSSVWSEFSGMQAWAAQIFLPGLPQSLISTLGRAIGYPTPGDELNGYIGWLNKFRRLSVSLARPAEVKYLLEAQMWKKLE